MKYRVQVYYGVTRTLEVDLPKEPEDRDENDEWSDKLYELIEFPNWEGWEVLDYEVVDMESIQ